MDGTRLSRITRTYTLGSEEFNTLNQVDTSTENGAFVAITVPLDLASSLSTIKIFPS